MHYYTYLSLWLKSELLFIKTVSLCSCVLSSASLCALQPPEEVPDPASFQKPIASRISAAVFHITLPSPLLQLAAGEHGCHFWKVSSCFSLTDQSILFWDNPLPKDAAVHRNKLSVSFQSCCYIPLSCRPFNNINVVVVITTTFSFFVFPGPGDNNTGRIHTTGNGPICGKREEFNFLQSSSM